MLGRSLVFVGGLFVGGCGETVGDDAIARDEGRYGWVLVEADGHTAAWARFGEPACPARRFGDCEVKSCAILDRDESLDAGVVSIVGGGVDIEFDTGQTADALAQQEPTPGAPLSVSVAGSREVPAFQAAVVVPRVAELEVAAGLPGGEWPDPVEDVELGWEGATSGVVQATVVGINTASPFEILPTQVYCEFQVDAGHGVVPAEATEQVSGNRFLTVRLSEREVVRRDDWVFTATAARVLVD